MPDKVTALDLAIDTLQKGYDSLSQTTRSVETRSGVALGLLAAIISRFVGKLQTSFPNVPRDEEPIVVFIAIVGVALLLTAGVFFTFGVLAPRRLPAPFSTQHMVDQGLWQEKPEVFKEQLLANLKFAVQKAAEGVERKAKFFNRGLWITAAGLTLLGLIEIATFMYPTEEG